MSINVPAFSENLFMPVAEPMSEHLEQVGSPKYQDFIPKILTESQVIFIKALTKTTEVASNEFKKALGTNYKLSKETTALRPQKCRIYKIIREDRKRVLAQLKLEGVCENKLSSVFAEIQKNMTRYKSNCESSSDILTGKQIEFVRALVISTQVGSKQFKEALGTKYRRSKTTNALLTKKCRIYKVIRENRQIVLDQLISKGVTEEALRDVLKEVGVSESRMKNKKVSYVKIPTSFQDRSSSSSTQALESSNKNNQSTEHTTQLPELALDEMEIFWNNLGFPEADFLYYN